MKRRLGQLVLALLLLLVLLLVVSAVYNRTLPTQSEVADRLTVQEKARLMELLQLREQLGDAVWPGWGAPASSANGSAASVLRQAQDSVPLIVYNESHAFLIGYSNPPAGWRTVPHDEQRGEAWQPVPNDSFNDQPYYRQPLPADGTTPQAFVVRVGDRWVSSMQTMEWMEIAFANQLREELPAFLAPVFPYTIVNNLFIRGSDGYISLLAHEAFHAFQGEMAAGKLAGAETAVSQHEPRYPWDDATLQANWQTELDLLADALEDENHTVELTKQFLAQRQKRRQEAGLTADFIAYEQQREWLEGLARYVELEVWRQAALSESYQPHPALLNDPKFNNYANFDRRWTQEIDQIRRMADGGDGRFYYTGMAQAILLDRLMPNWKEQAFDEGVWLEGLLETAFGS